MKHLVSVLITPLPTVGQPTHLGCFLIFVSVTNCEHLFQLAFVVFEQEQQSFHPFMSSDC